MSIRFLALMRADDQGRIWAAPYLELDLGPFGYWAWQVGRDGVAAR